MGEYKDIKAWPPAGPFIGWLKEGRWGKFTRPKQTRDTTQEEADQQFRIMIDVFEIESWFIPEPPTK